MLRPACGFPVLRTYSCLCASHLQTFTLETVRTIVPLALLPLCLGESGNGGVGVCARVCVCTGVCTRGCVHTGVHGCVCAHGCVHVGVCGGVCTDVCVCGCACRYAWVCVHGCVCARVISGPCSSAGVGCPRSGAGSCRQTWAPRQEHTPASPASTAHGNHGREPWEAQPELPASSADFLEQL